MKLSAKCVQNMNIILSICVLNVVKYTYVEIKFQNTWKKSKHVCFIDNHFSFCLGEHYGKGGIAFNFTWYKENTCKYEMHPDCGI